MTPKDKAQELYGKYMINISSDNWKKETVKIAIICVDEIINEYQHEIPQSEFYDPDERLEFWEQVKQELNERLIQLKR